MSISHWGIFPGYFECAENKTPVWTYWSFDGWSVFYYDAEGQFVSG